MRPLAVALALALTTLAACGDRNNQHASDGDSGAAAPATTRDMSATPKAGDSTAGVAGPTGGTPPAGTTDTTKQPMAPRATNTAPAARP